MCFSLLRGTLFAALAVNGALVALVGCSSHPASVSSAPASPVPAPQSTYVGSAACAQCHQAEYISQSHTRHAKTLTEVTRKALGPLAPATGRIPRTSLVVTRLGGRFKIGLSAHPSSFQSLDYALGSGKTGMTYVSLLAGGRIGEIAMSYFPHRREWHVTPEDETLPMDSVGRIRPPVDS